MTRITFAGQLTEEQYTQMQWLTTPWLRRRFGWFMLACFVMVFGTGGWQVVVADPVDQGLRIVAALLFTAFMVAFPRRAIRKQWQGNAVIKSPVNGAADEVALEWNSSFAAARFPWEAILKRKTAADMVLLYTAPNAVLYFPKAFFADEAAWAEFVVLSLRKVPRTK